LPRLFAPLRSYFFICLIFLEKLSLHYQSPEVKSLSDSSCYKSHVLIEWFCLELSGLHKIAEIGHLNAETGHEPVGVSIFTIDECQVQAVIGLED